jgi:maleate isomerase
MRLGSVVIGHSSSSIVGGEGWDAAVVESLAGVLPEGVFVTTNGLDSLAALRASAVRRPFLVLPPWYDVPTCEMAVAYYRAHGAAPAGYLRYDPGPGWRDMAAGALYPNGMGFAQEIEPLYAQVRGAVPAEADGVFIAGTGFRCVGIIEVLEQDLGRPVLSANQVSLWHALRRCGVRRGVAGYGALLRM